MSYNLFINYVYDAKSMMQNPYLSCVSASPLSQQNDWGRLLTKAKEFSWWHFVRLQVQTAQGLWWGGLGCFSSSWTAVREARETGWGQAQAFHNVSVKRTDQAPVRNTLSQPVVLNLLVEFPLGSNNPFTGLGYQISCILDNYITIHHSSKVIVMK